MGKHTHRGKFWLGTSKVWCGPSMIHILGFIKRPSHRWIETPSSAPSSQQPSVLWGQPSLSSCRPGSTCQQPEGRVNQALINPEIWNFKKNADVFLKVYFMPRACWQRGTLGNSMFYPLEIASIPINTTVNWKKLDQFPRAPLPPPQVAQSSLEKHVGQHCQTLT